MSMDEAEVNGKKPEPFGRDDLEREFERLGGEEGIRARHAFRKNLRHATERFREALMTNPSMGPAEVRCHQHELRHAVENATIEFQAALNRFEQKI